jgi:hypothetical protein
MWAFYFFPDPVVPPHLFQKFFDIEAHAFLRYADRHPRQFRFCGNLHSTLAQNCFHPAKVAARVCRCIGSQDQIVEIFPHLEDNPD